MKYVPILTLVVMALSFLALVLRHGWSIMHALLAVEAAVLLFLALLVAIVLALAGRRHWRLALQAIWASAKEGILETRAPAMATTRRKRAKIGRNKDALPCDRRMHWS